MFPSGRSSIENLLKPFAPLTAIGELDEPFNS